jgi:hypothetical protein
MHVLGRPFPMNKLPPLFGLGEHMTAVG